MNAHPTMNHSTPVARISALAILSALIVGLTIFAGCKGVLETQDERQDIGTLAFRSSKVLPPVDSLGDVRLMLDSKDSTAIETEISYEAAVLRWSVRAIGNNSGLRINPRPYTTYATFFGKEMRLVQLQRNRGIESLTGDIVVPMIREELDQHKKTFRIDVSLYRRGQGTAIDVGLNSEAYILIDGEAYEAREIIYSAGRSLQAARRGALNNEFTILFDRMEEEKDILDDAEEAELIFQPYGPGVADLVFNWRFHRADPLQSEK